MPSASASRHHRPAQSLLDRLADALFSTDGKRRIRSMQSLVAFVIGVAGVATMGFGVGAGLVAAQEVRPWAWFAIVGSLVLYGLIRAGVTAGWRDPSLTMAHLVHAVVCCAWGYAIAGPLRGGVFPLVMVVMSFGMFSLSPRRVMVISALGVVLFGVAMALMAHLRPVVFVPSVEMGHFLMVATMMPMVSLLAAQLGRLRARLQAQKRELAEALARIQFLATRDELTGLVNRRQMTELMHIEMRRFERHGSRFCIAMIDLDHFKQVNDQHGHAAGDEALRRFAEQGQQMVRATDALARWGGEEFLLLLADSALPLAREGAERLRQAMRALTVQAGSSRFHLTLSAGVVQVRADETLEQLLERADAALYRAKAQGRDRVEMG